MTDNDTIRAVIEAGDRRRDERRRFLRFAGGATATAGGLALLAACGDNSSPTPAPSPTPTGSPSPAPSPTPAFAEVDVLNFALNLEYLEATFYSLAAFGTDLPDAQTTGTGTRGAVTGGRRVTFTDPVIAQYAREIASDEIAHVAYLRTALGGSAVARPALNIDGTNATTGAFALAAQAAGVVAVGAPFDPYATDENFLLGAFIFEDVGVTAYRGAITSIRSKSVLEATAGIHAAEAYHAGLIRTLLYAKGVDNPSLLTSTTNISNTRDQLDGATLDRDQPIVGTTDIANIVPADTNGIVFGRDPTQVLNILYLTRDSVIGGGFLPAGANGTLNKSAVS